jgi:hypothetical protein
MLHRETGELTSWVVVVILVIEQGWKKSLRD